MVRDLKLQELEKKTFVFIILSLFIFSIVVGLLKFHTSSNTFKYGIYNADRIMIDSGNDLVSSASAIYEIKMKPEKRLGDSSNAIILSVTDTPEDSDNNGYYDFIRFDAQVEVFITGVYDLRVELQNTDGHHLWSYEFYTGIESWQYLEPGNHTLSQYFDSAWICRQSTIQNFTIHTLQLVKMNPDRLWDLWDYQEADILFNYGMTKEYDPIDFDPPEMLFIDYGSSYSDDIDSPPDGLYDYLVFDIQVQVFAEGHYRIEGQLSDMSNNWVTWETLFEENLGIGSQTLKLRFPSGVIYETFLNQSYQLNHFRIYYDIDDTEWCDEWFQIDVIGIGGEVGPTTTIYNFLDFQPPIITLTHNYYDHGWDSTPEKLGFSGLAIEVEVNVNKTNDYFAELFLSNNKTGEEQWLRSETHTLNPGIRNITVICEDICWLWSQLDDSVFQIHNINIYWNDERYDHYDDIAYTLRHYSKSEFDVPDIVLTGYYTDRIMDENDNSLIDKIEIDVGIEVTVESAEVWVEGWLGNDSWNDMVCGWYHSNWYEESQLPQGTHIITLCFEAGSLFDLRITSLLSLHWVMVARTDTGWYQTDFVEHSVPLSRVIKWEECEASLVSVDKVVGESLVDTDDDGLYDYLGITIRVLVREASEYSVTGSLFYSDGQDCRHNWVTTTNQLNLGYNDITLYWPCMNFDRDGFSGKWAFELRDIQFNKRKGDSYGIRLHGSLQQESGSHYWYRTDILDLSQCERYPVDSIRVISAEPVDLDYDGYFDFIEANIEINSFTSGDYYFEAVLADWSGGWDDHIEWRGKVVKLITGKNLVTLYYSGCQIYDRAIFNAQFGIEGFTLYKSYTDLDMLLVDGWGVRVYDSDWNNWYYLPVQYDYSEFSDSCYDDPTHPQFQSLTFNGVSYYDDNFQVIVGTDLVIETKISNLEKISEVYCQIDGDWYFMSDTELGIYVCKKFMGISGLDYGIQIIVRDIYGNEYWSDWYGVFVVEEYSTTETTTKSTDITETTEIGTEEVPTIQGIPGFEIVILLPAVLVLYLIYRRKFRWQQLSTKQFAKRRPEKD